MSSGTPESERQSKNTACIKHCWNKKHDIYACRDGNVVQVPRKTANVRDLDKVKTVPRSMVLY